MSHAKIDVCITIAQFTSKILLPGPAKSSPSSALPACTHTARLHSLHPHTCAHLGPKLRKRNMHFSLHLIVAISECTRVNKFILDDQHKSVYYQCSNYHAYRMKCAAGLWPCIGSKCNKAIGRSMYCTWPSECRRPKVPGTTSW